jgi:hypothetical protein
MSIINSNSLRLEIIKNNKFKAQDLITPILKIQLNLLCSTKIKKNSFISIIMKFKLIWMMINDQKTENKKNSKIIIPAKSNYFILFLCDFQKNLI